MKSSETYFAAVVIVLAPHLPMPLAVGAAIVLAVLGLITVAKEGG